MLVKVSNILTLLELISYNDSDYEYFGRKEDNKKNGFGIIIWGQENEEQKSAGEYNLLSQRVYKQHTISDISQSSGQLETYDNYQKDTKLNNRPPSFRSKFEEAKKTKSKGVIKTSGNKLDLIQNSNTKLIGVFKKDKISGFAKFISLNCNYSGELKENIANGYGFFTNNYGVVYEGQWNNDLQHGIGVESTSDNSLYEGEFEFGMKSGFGKYFWADGSKYEGEWKSNNMHGYGIYTTPDGKEYTGEFLNSAMHGFGILTLVKGEKYYYGSFEKDKKHGFGALICFKPSFKVYIGFWANSKQNGLGKLISLKSKEKDSFQKSNVNTEESVDIEKGVNNTISKYGIWSNGERVKWVKSIEEAQNYLKPNEFGYYYIFQNNWNNLSFLSNTSK